MTRFSVIIPARDAEATLTEAARSVLDQGRGDVEIIIVDDHSSDGTAQRATDLAAASAGTVRLVTLETGSGVSAARNAGISAARGEILLFLDADDVHRPGLLDTVDAAFETSVDAVVVGHVLRTGSGRRERAGRLQGDVSGSRAARGVLRDEVTPFPWDKALRRSLIPPSPFPEGVHRFEDLATMAVLLSRARRVRILPDPLIEYRVRRGSLTWSRIPTREERDTALRHIERHLPLTLRSRTSRDLPALRVLLTVLIAQSAALSGTAPDLLAACRADLRRRDVLRAIRRHPSAGAAGALLRISPRLFTLAVRRRTERTYGP